MNLQEEIKTHINAAVKKLFGAVSLPEVVVELPKDSTHGDYATNVAFLIAKHLKKNPVEVALALQEEIQKKSTIFKEVKAIGGFVNFFVQDHFFVDYIAKAITHADKVGRNNSLKNKKIIIEYTD